MRPLIVAVALLVPSIASAQYPSGVWYGGPYAPSRVAPGYNYYNASAPVYPVAGNPFGAGYRYGWEQQMELRRIRFELEELNSRRVPLRRSAYLR